MPFPRQKLRNQTLEFKRHAISVESLDTEGNDRRAHDCI